MTNRAPRQRRDCVELQIPAAPALLPPHSAAAGSRCPAVEGRPPSAPSAAGPAPTPARSGVYALGVACAQCGAAVGYETDGARRVIATGEPVCSPECASEVARV